MAITVQNLRSGATFEENGQPQMVLKYEHIKMGRGSATIRVKVKNLLTGTVTDKTYINSAKVEEINTARRQMQFLFSDKGGFAFMDPASFEQVTLSPEVVGEQGGYLKEGILVNILFWEDRPLWVELPPKMNFYVVETDPGVKGNSVTNIYKAAKLDNGMTVKVPLFIKEGDQILVDTRDGSYSERVK